MTRASSTEGNKGGQIQADSHWMRKALELAGKAEGLTRPNPPVGAILVKKNRVVSTGVHRKAGAAHAEAIALRNAGPDARNATLYVTLEPCSTTGRTKPCAEALIESGIKRVVVGVIDPNPCHQGRGLRRLRANGVQVRCGVEKESAQHLIEPFTRWITKGVPWVSLKIGMTLDGKIADRRNVSRWITGPDSRKKVQNLRRRIDAILIGSSTARLDDPSLLPRPANGRKPFRVILGGQRLLPRTLQCFSDAAAERTIVIVPEPHAKRWEKRLRKSACLVHPVPPGRNGRPRVNDVLQVLGAEGWLHVLCEGGGETAASFIRAGAINRFHMVVAPCFLGERGVSAVGGLPWPLDKAPRLAVESISKAGEDVWITAVPKVDESV